MNVFLVSLLAVLLVWTSSAETKDDVLEGEVADALARALDKKSNDEPDADNEEVQGVLEEILKNAFEARKMETAHKRGLFRQIKDKIRDKLADIFRRPFRPPFPLPTFPNLPLK